MSTPWRIGLFVGLAILGGRTAAEAQTQPAGGPAPAGAPVSASSSNAAIIAPPSASAVQSAMSRRRADPSFNRVVTTRRAPASRASGAAATDRGPIGQPDPLRPYSARVRAANAQAAMGSTRPQPRAVSPPPTVQSPRNYYPGMRVSQHPNANVPTVRPHCVPTRGGVMGGGLGLGGSTPAGSGRGGTAPAGAAQGR